EVAARLYNFYQQLSSPSSSPSSASFDRYKDIVTRELEAFDNLQPYQHAGYHANLLLEEPKWPIPTIRDALLPLTLADLAAFASPSTLFSQGYGTALLQGNILESEAIALTETVAAAIPFGAVLPKEKRTSRQITRLPATPSSSWGLLLRRPEENKENTNGACQLCFQVESKEMKTR
ncbi:hypothetical protein VYU27_010656, partial [Nannochloropsis oceanica]